MQKSLSSLALIAGLCLSVSFGTAQADQTYNGNGATGFGGAFGNSSLAVTDDAGTGLISFVLTAAAGLNNDVVFYIAPSASGTFTDTSSLSDNADGGRTAISGFSSSNSSRTTATFAPGFGAKFALLLDVPDGFAGLFQLASGGNNSLIFLKNANYTNPSTNVYDFNILASDLGLQTGTGDTFSFEGTYISSTAYRSDETYGASTVTNPGNAPNPGFTGGLNFTSADIYTLAIPEPGTIGMMVAGAGMLLFFRRRRTRS